MTEYEILSDKLKLRWHENFNLTNEEYRQVSGYIFNEKGQILIVKNDAWVFPGGHPEKGETQLETLTREIMEEACVTVKDIHYVGAVEVVENGETYYQLRYTAKLDEILPFVKEWETSERAFIDMEELLKYVPWAKGTTCQEQLKSVKKVWANL